MNNEIQNGFIMNVKRKGETDNACGFSPYSQQQSSSFDFTLNMDSLPDANADEVKGLCFHFYEKCAGRVPSDTEYVH